MICHDDTPPNKAILERLCNGESKLFQSTTFRPKTANAGLLELLTQSQKIILKLSIVYQYNSTSVHNEDVADNNGEDVATNSRRHPFGFLGAF